MSRIVKISTVFILIFLLTHVKELTELYGQEMPPRPIELVALQTLSFGRIVLGDGEVEVPNDGGPRITTGDVVGLSGTWHPSIFDIVANPGTVIRLDINQNAPVTLNNPQSGQLTCDLTDARIDGIEYSHNQTFTMPLGKTIAETVIGGTLHINKAEPAGAYQGSFNITIIYE